MNQLRIKLRKKLWITLKATPEEEYRVIYRLLRSLGNERQSVHIAKMLDHAVDDSPTREYQTDERKKIVYSIAFRWTGITSHDQLLEVFDWLSPIVYQATKAGTFAGLRQLLLEAEGRS